MEGRIPALPLLTALNFFNYLDRQVVFSMTTAFEKEFHLTKGQLGWLTLVNIAVFGLACLISGPIADRIGPRKVIFSGVVIWSLATLGSALSTSFPMLLVFRGLVGIGEGAYGPSANMILCTTAKPGTQGRAMGIYNVGMAIGGSTGLFLGGYLEPKIGWQGVFLIAGIPSLLLAGMTWWLAAPARLERPHAEPARAYLLNPTFLLCLVGGVLVTFAGSGLLFWARQLIIEIRGFSVLNGSILMGAIGIGCGIGGVLTGGLLGDRVGRFRPGGHALVMAVSLIIAIPIGFGSLSVTNHFAFVVLTGGSVFFLSIYNGPATVVVDQLAPRKYAATLQAVFLFGIHMLGDAPAAKIVGHIADHTGLALALNITVVAFGISGFLFLAASRRQHALGLAAATAPALARPAT